MTRTRHYTHPTHAFPVYCLDWTDDEVILLGGGGGASRSGIGNKLVRFCHLAALMPETMQGFQRRKAVATGIRSLAER